MSSVSNSTTSSAKKLTNFPFAAIIGQDEMKLALQLNIIDPKIGGVMIMGERGTGKSTTIRALADLLPDIEIIKNQGQIVIVYIFFAKNHIFMKCLNLNLNSEASVLISNKYFGLYFDYLTIIKLILNRLT